MTIYEINKIYIFEWPEFKSESQVLSDSFGIAEIEEKEDVGVHPGCELPFKKGSCFYARFVGTIYNINDYKEGGKFYLGKTLVEARDKVYQMEREDRTL